MFRGWFKHAGDDFAGGIISAAVAIPLAVGYGMFALASLGENYFAAGALAGLASALLVAIACAFLGDKTATVYAPRVNSTFFLGLLIYGLIHSGAPEITAGGVPLILAIAFSVVLLGGAFEALFGLVRLGALIKFAPQPVMAGFQNAAALLLFLVQLGNVCGFDHNVPFTQVPAQWMDIKPLSVIIAAITFAAMWNSRKLLPKVPPMLVGIVLGCTSIISAGCSAWHASRAGHRQWARAELRIHRLSLFFRTRSIVAFSWLSLPPSSPVRWRSPSSPRSTRCFAPSL